MGDKFINASGLSAIRSWILNLLGGKQDALISGTNIKTINNTSILDNGNIDVLMPSDVVSTVTDGSTSPVSGGGVKNYVDGVSGNLQTQIDALGEAFRLQDFNQQINVTIPSVTQTIQNTSIPNVDVDLDIIDPTGNLNTNFAIASLAKYEVYDAISGGNRLNVMPVCSFSMNGQRVLRIRMMCAGTSSVTARRIQGAMLLKHR